MSFSLIFVAAVASFYLLFLVADREQHIEVGFAA